MVWKKELKRLKPKKTYDKKFSPIFMNAKKIILKKPSIESLSKTNPKDL